MKIIDSLKKKLNFNYEKIFRHFAIATDILFTLVLLLRIFNYLPVYWNVAYVFYFVIFINTLWIMFKIKNIPEEKRDKNPLIYIFQYLFLLTLIVFAVNQFVKNQIVTEWTPYLTALSIGFGFLTFYSHRNKVEKEIEDEKVKEEDKEKKRKEEFSVKFPRINKIWGLRSIVKWMYKEGWVYSLCLVGILIYGCFLIFPNLGINDIYHDEQWHLQVIESLIHEQGFRLWNFITQSPMMHETNGNILNFLEYLLVILFGKSSLVLRIIPALFGVLNILLVYLIFRKFIGKFLALVICFGFTVNINALYLARFLRPYTLSFFFYLLAFYLVLVVLENMKKNKGIKQNIISVIALIFLIGLSIEERELGKILLFLIPSIFFISFWLNRTIFCKLIKKNWIAILVALFIIGVLIFFLDYFKLINLSILPNQVKEFISMDKVSSPNVSYYHYLFEKYIKFPVIFYFLFIVGAFYLLSKTLRSDNHSLILSMFSLPPLFILVYFLQRYSDPRYCYFLVPFIYAVSLTGLLVLTKIYLTNHKKKVAFLFILITSIVLLFYPVFPMRDIQGFSLKSPTVWTGHDAETYWHDRGVAPDYSLIYDYLNKVQEEGDSIIFIDGEWNILAKSGVTYYKINPWTYSRIVVRLDTYNKTSWVEETPKGEDFFDLFKEKNNKKVYVVGAYFLMLDEKMKNYLLDNCINIARDLGAMKYSSWKSKEVDNLYYPNLFVCEKKS